MFERFQRSWELTKQSAAILAENKFLMFFPVMSAMATLVVIASFFVPLFFSGALEHMNRRGTPQSYLTMFVFYFLCYFIQIFFNCALMASANRAFCGGKAEVGDGLGTAFQCIGQIIVYSAIAATVGLILRAIEERVGWIGKIVVALMGTAWSIMTYFIAPVIVFEGLGAFDGVQRSTQLIKQTWGEGVGKGLGWAAISFVGVLFGVVVSFVLVAANVWLGIGFAVIYFLLFVTVLSTLDGIFKVALYRYATWKVAPEGFDPELLQSSFAIKEKKGLFGR